MSNMPQSPVDWGDTPPPNDGRSPRPPVSFWVVLRVVVMVFGLLSLAFWGYYSWPFPMPAILFMVAAPGFAALVWFLFRSPRSPLGTDPVGKAIVEIALIVAASGAWVSIGFPWVGLVFFVAAAASGIVQFRKDTADG
jgi:hypothetical protein